MGAKGVLTGNITELDLSAELVMIGTDNKREFMRLMSLLLPTAIALDLVGPPGSGKSHMVTAMCVEYAKMMKCKAFFCQGNPDSTKGEMIGGPRMANGSVLPFMSTIALAMEEGHIVFFDELTHAPKALMTTLNTVLDRNSRTNIAEHTVFAHPNFRIIFAHNNARYANNNPLPPSFAGRLFTMPFEYPSIETEARIAKRIAQGMLRGSDVVEVKTKVVNGETVDDITLPIPDSVIRHATSLFREIRTKNMLLATSARNIANLIYMLSIYPKDEAAPIDASLNTGTDAPAKQQRIAERVYWKQQVSSSELRGKDVSTFLEFVSKFGLDAYRKAVMSTCGVYLDIDGISLTSMEKIRQEVHGMII